MQEYPLQKSGGSSSLQHKILKTVGCKFISRRIYLVTHLLEFTKLRGVEVFKEVENPGRENEEESIDELGNL